MDGNIISSTVLSLLFWCLSITEGHVRFMKPLSRSSLWREYRDEAGAVNYDDNQLFCGGAYILARNGGLCGICGDNYAHRQPRDNEVGGRYYTGFIPPESRYVKGETIKVYLYFTANHKGYVQFKVCPYPTAQPREEVSQNCLDSNTLSIKQRDGSFSDMHDVPSTMLHGNYFDVILPPDLTCEHCVFQFRYRGGNSWGTDRNTGRSCVGCGDQEEFWGCADISISSDGGERPLTDGGGVFRPPQVLPPVQPTVIDATIRSFVPTTPYISTSFSPPIITNQEHTITSCKETVTVKSLPCCYGRPHHQEFNDFCMTKSGADCPANYCVRQNDHCHAGQGTRLFCMGLYPWTGVLDTWCFDHCLLVKDYPSKMCFCMTLPE